MIMDNTCYLVALKPVATYLKDHVREIGKYSVQIVKRDRNVLENFHPQWESLILHVSSFRLDTILSKIMMVSRSKVEEKILKKEVLVNYQVISKKDYLLNLQDIFSIRGYGKYIFKDILYRNKKGNLDIEILKYK